MVSPQHSETPSGEEPLPDFEVLDYDLSAPESKGDSTYENVPKGSQIESDDDPEGIFYLYDGEFEDRQPVSTPDDEFLQDFNSMFDGATQGEDIPGLSSPGEKSQGNLATEPEPEVLAKSLKELPPNLISTEELILEDSQSFEEALPDPTTYELDGWDEDEPSSGSFSDSLAIEESEHAQEISPSHEEDFLADDSLSSDLEEDFDGEELEEISFDSDEEDFDGDDFELDSDDERDFEEFMKLATGNANTLADEFEPEEADEDEDDFSLEDIDGEEAIDADPFGELDIIDSGDKDNLEGVELELDEIANPSEEQAFENGDSDFGSADGYDPLAEIDPFSDEAMELEETRRRLAEEDTQEAESDEPGKAQKKAKKPKKSSKPRTSGALGKLLSFLLFPWRIYGKIVGLVFGVLTKILGVLGGLPFVGRVFKLAASALGAIPLAAKKAIVLLLIGGVIFGGSAIVSSLIPKPSGTIELPDSGSASFKDVTLEDGLVKGALENTGDVRAYIYPSVTPKERTLNPLSWFSPKELERCSGELQELAIGESREITFPCAVDGWISLDVLLEEG